MRQTWTGDYQNAAQQLFQNAAHGGGAQKQRFLPAAQMQDAVGKDVAALKVAGKLDFVYGDKGGGRFARHRLNGADRIARCSRHDLFFAGDQSNLGRTDLFADPGVDLAGQQPKRQADQAAFMRNHALDSEMRLARVGGAKHCGHVASG
jgi:hypothetical protein